MVTVGRHHPSKSQLIRGTRITLQRTIWRKKLMEMKLWIRGSYQPTKMWRNKLMAMKLGIRGFFHSTNWQHRVKWRVVGSMTHQDRNLINITTPHMTGMRMEQHKMEILWTLTWNWTTTTN